MINKAIRKVPNRLKEDAFQAGCVGLVVGLEKSNGANNPDGYVYTCIRNEVIRLMASLNEIYAIDTNTLMKLLKYKKHKAYGQELSPKFTTATVEQLEKILKTRGINV